MVARMVSLGRDIKLSHSVFAMPWALLAAVLAGRGQSAAVLAAKLALVIACMVFARTVAMTANRLFDAELDARNPRTAARALPSGRLSRGFMRGILLLSAAAFLAGTLGFYFFFANFWPIALALPVLAFVSTYPLLKRFTALCHYYLGAALALAPICAWLAVRGSLATAPILMAGVVLLWTAGFDIIYACQDYSVDVAQRLHSVPARFGIAGALAVSRITHAACAALLILLATTTPGLGRCFAAGVGLAILLLVVEHLLVRPNDLSKVGLAFFTVNGIFSLLLGGLGIVDLLMR